VYNVECGCWTQVQVLDDKNVRRRFRASNYQASAAAVGMLATAEEVERSSQHVCGSSSRYAGWHNRCEFTGFAAVAGDTAKAASVPLQDAFNAYNHNSCCLVVPVAAHETPTCELVRARITSTVRSGSCMRRELLVSRCSILLGVATSRMCTLLMLMPCVSKGLGHFVLWYADTWY
jgi:hypothetical protein